MGARDPILLDKLVISRLQRSISLIHIKKKTSQRVQNYILKHLVPSWTSLFMSYQQFLYQIDPASKPRCGFCNQVEEGVKISSIQLCRPQSAGDIRGSHVSWQCVHEAEQAVCSFTAIKPLQCWKMQLRGDTNKLLYEAISVASPGID